MNPEHFPGDLPGFDPRAHLRGFAPRGFGARGFGPRFDPAGFTAGGRGHRRANRGDIRLAILSLLAEGPASGYALIKAIEQKTDGLWRPSPGSVYPTLQQLTDEELVESVGDGKRSEYRLTETGRDYAAEHEAELAGAWQSAPGRSEADAAFLQSVAKLMGVVHQFRFGATDEQRAAAAGHLDELRRTLYLILAD